MHIKVSGACDAQAALNGDFLMRGYTVSGAPYYSSDALKYLYFDPDCSGDGARPGWVFDNSAPDPMRKHDLDNDGRCTYNARLVDAEAGLPPTGAQKWKVACGPREWRDLELMLLPPQEPQDRLLPSPPCVPCLYLACGLAGISMMLLIFGAIVVYHHHVPSDVQQVCEAAPTAHPPTEQLQKAHDADLLDSLSSALSVHLGVEDDWVSIGTVALVFSTHFLGLLPCEACRSIACFSSIIG